MGQRRQEEMVVIFPFMAQGHIIPFLALALQIEQRFGYKIVFVNTPLNIKKLHSSLPTNSTISLLELPFCSTDHGLPPDTENTDTLHFSLICPLLEASLSLKTSFNQLMVDLTKKQGYPPLCIIADMFFSWTVDIAHELNIFHSIFITASAYGMGVYYSMWLNLPHCKTNSEEFTLPDFPEVGSIHRSQLPNNLKNSNGTDSWSKYLRKYMPLWFKSDGILFNTVEELDQIGLKYFRRKIGGRPVWPILPGFEYRKECTNEDGAIFSVRPQKKSGVDLEKCMAWLHTCSERSVIFVSFGSQSTISTSQMMQLAIGLEASGKNFIWVVRPPIEFAITEEFRSEWLPKGYEDRVNAQNRGLLVHKWAPQLEILAHKSTGAFISHCGWNSVLESLSHGVPLLGWPLGSEQTYNSKFLEEEVGVCIEVCIGTACEVKHENIKKAIEMVMGESEKGVQIRNKACAVKDMMEDALREELGFKASSVKAIEGFLDAALSMRK
nr:glycosyltransferase [Helleborus thibetanus]